MINNKVIYTIGHSTRGTDEFIKILQFYKISLLIDIRTIPRSKTNPQFNSDILENKLKEVGIKYLHISGLGGLRHPLKDSVNIGWRNSSFRGYADYMQTKDFNDNLEKLIELSNNDIVLLMCAEVLPWRCHRTLIADALLTRGINVKHIFSENNVKTHKLTEWAKVEGTKITYPLPKIEIIKENQ